MTNPNKRKGTDHEVRTTSSANNFAKAVGAELELYRPAPSGRVDSGDVHGGRPFLIQCKNYADLATGLRLGLDGAVKQAEVYGADYGVNVLKRRNASIGDAFAVMRYQDFVRVMLRLRRAEALLDEKAPMASGYHHALTDAEGAETFPRA